VDERGVLRLIDGLRLFGRGGSWGGFESLAWTARPERTIAPLPYAGPLFRISAGLEDATDLIDDLQDGFERMRAHCAPDA
jgi:cystathionine beta-lyase